MLFTAEIILSEKTRLNKNEQIKTLLTMKKSLVHLQTQDGRQETAGIAMLWQVGWSQEEAAKKPTIVKNCDNQYAIERYYDWLKEQKD